MLKKTVEKLMENASLYMDMIRSAVSFGTKVCFELSDTEESVTLILGKEVYLEDGCLSPDLKVSLNSNILRDVLEGKVDPYSLSARASRLEKRPVEAKFLNLDRLDELLEVYRAILMYLLLSGRIKVRHFEPYLAGEAHGAHPIPLVNWDGLRCAYFILYKGEVLNKEGERDRWPQLFIVLRGEGLARIEDEKLQVRDGVAIYIPKNAIHQLKPLSEKLELIWIAWNASETKPPRKSCNSPYCPFHGKTRVIGPWLTASIKSLNRKGFAETIYSKLQHVHEAKRYREVEEKLIAYVPPCVEAKSGDNVLICGTLADKKTPPYVVVAKIRG